MPHQIIEYSANLESRLSISDLIDTLHETAAKIDAFPLGGLRTRAARREHYKIADGHPDNAFVHLTWKLGHGRSEALRHEFGEHMFAVLCDFLEGVSASFPLAISFEIQEIHPVLTFKKNNLRDYMAERSK
jgi:5-carboxymethyl-2-hydroxymuconate isomerase